MVCVQGEKVCLKTFTRDEYHEFCKMYIADSIMDPDPYVYDKKTEDKEFDAIMEKESWYKKLGIFITGDTPIGCMSIKRIDFENSQCELGIVLANDRYKGLGYGTEAVKLSIDYVFKNLMLRYIYADTMGSNMRMQKIFHKFGFIFVNREVHRYDMHDRWEDKLNYMLLNPQYAYTYKTGK